MDNNNEKLKHQRRNETSDSRNYNLLELIASMNVGFQGFIWSLYPK